MSEPKIPAGDDVLLWGAGEIGRAIRRSEQATSRRLRLGHLSATTVGDRWVASASRLRQALIGGELHIDLSELRQLADDLGVAHDQIPFAGARVLNDAGSSRATPWCTVPGLEKVHRARAA